MKVLITGAAGKVGRMVRRALAGRHAMRFYDLAPIESGEGEMVVGDILDRPALTQAMTGMDALIHLAYGREPGAGQEVQERLSFDVNAKGTYYVAQAAAAAGIRHAVYASSLSLYEGHMPGPGARFTEMDPPLPLHSYALTKYFGEEIFRAYAAQGHFSVISLRLTLPTEMDEWEAIRQQRPESGIYRTAGTDVGQAFLLALEKQDVRFEAIHIASETPGCPWDISKAHRLLNYKPTFQFI